MLTYGSHYHWKLTDCAIPLYVAGHYAVVEKEKHHGFSNQRCIGRPVHKYLSLR